MVLSSDVDIGSMHQAYATHLLGHEGAGSLTLAIQKLGSQLDLEIWIWKATRTNVTFGSYQTLLQFHR